MKACSLDLVEVSRDTSCRCTMCRDGPHPHSELPDAISCLDALAKGLPICQSLSYVSGLLGLSNRWFLSGRGGYMYFGITFSV